MAKEMEARREEKTAEKILKSSETSQAHSQRREIRQVMKNVLSKNKTV